MRSQQPRSGPTSSSDVHVVPVPSLADEELVRRAVAGDGWAEEAIFRRYANLVLGTARHLLADSEEAKDVTQDTFSAAMAAWPELRDPARLKQWLLQIAVSKVHRRFRRRKLLRVLGFESGAEDATLSALARPECDPETRVELSLLSRALERISPGCRIAWTLRHVEGFSLGEIADSCSCSLATVKRRLVAAEAHVEDYVARTGK